MSQHARGQAVGAATQTHPPSHAPHPIQIALLFSVFVIAACGLLYELAAGAIASYLLGDSILQFSTIIGSYLFAMGIGSWLSRYLERELPTHFVRIELLVGFVGGFMPTALYLAHTYLTRGFGVLLYGLVLLIGMLVGLEIPLVMRILKRHATLRDVVSQVLTVDYLGALAVSLAFPLVLMPQLGLLRTGLLFGLLNAAVGLWTLWVFRYQIARPIGVVVLGVVVLALLAAGFALANRVTSMAEAHQYQAPVVISAQSPYQRIAVTRRNDQLRLYLNGNLQFAQSDEYRYHEALVHPVMAAYAEGAAPRRAAVLGGGDGMAVREILKYPGVESITLIELDPNMTRMFSTDPLLTPLNQSSLTHPKVRIVNADAFTWLQQHDEVFDVIVVDFPDPTNFSVGKLFTNSFYSVLDSRLAQGGYAVVQTTSPLIARKSFWTVVQTIESVGFTATPYHAHVPSFGEWGFVIASRRPWRLPQTLPQNLRFLDAKTLPLLFDFPPDMARVPAEVNRLSSQVLVRTYEEEWGKVLK